MSEPSTLTKKIISQSLYQLSQHDKIDILKELSSQILPTRQMFYYDSHCGSGGNRVELGKEKYVFVFPK